MKRKMISILKNLAHGPLAPVAYVLIQVLTATQYIWLSLLWRIKGKGRPSEAEQRLVVENVTFLYKSFQRQRLAKRLYRNLQRYYPGIRVIIADDSEKPLNLSGPGLEVVQLPFNSGLSYGLNRALEKVATPFVVRLDDDELLTPISGIHKQLEFLRNHPEVDIAAVMPLSLPTKKSLREMAGYYFGNDMSDAPKKLRIPHGTYIDESHVVLGKVPNIFVARTEKLRAVGYDDNIRMMDHNEFFFRAAGVLVSVLDYSCAVLHYHNRFNKAYQKYREDVNRDRQYIFLKHYAGGAWRNGRIQ